MMFAGIPTGSIKQAQAAGPAPIPANDQFPAPNPVYTEDFENNVNATGTPSSIDGYRAESDTPRYTAGNYWKDPNVCNGFIASANNQITLNAIRDTYCGPNSSDTYNNNGTQKNTWGRTDADYAAVRTKAFALAKVNLAGNPDPNGKFISNGSHVGSMSNHALSTDTSGGAPGNVPGNMFIMPDQSAIDASSVRGRFINFSVDAATSNCAATSPRLQFFMNKISATGGDNEVALNSTPTDTCDSTALADYQQVQVNNDPTFSSKKMDNDDGSNTKGQSVTYSGYTDWVNTVARGTVYGSQAQLIGTDVSKLGLRLYNSATSSSTGKANTVIKTWGQGTQNGNDGAIDNIRILDVTPRLTKSFSPDVTSVGATSRLTLTVNNRADNAVKDGWGFTDTLPSGLTFAANPNLGGTCLASPNAATVNADKNSNALVVTNGKLGGAGAGQTLTNCTIQVDVTSTTAALYSNGQDNMSQQVGIDGPTTPAKVKFTKGSVRWQKVDGVTKQALAGSQWQITRTGSNLPTGSNVATTNGQANGPVTVGPALNASFNITDTGTGQSSSVDNSITTYTTDADSGAGFLASQYLPWGTYSLKETQAPAGYKPSTTTYTFTIGSGGLTTADNTVISNPVSLSGVSNSQVPNTSVYGGVRWAKADSSTGNMLSGSEWKITGPSGSSSQDLAVTDCVGSSANDCPGTGKTGPDVNFQAGQFEVQKLLPGDYTLTETKAPDGYAVDPAVHKFTVTTGTTVDLQVLQNTSLPVCKPNSPNLYNQLSTPDGSKDHIGATANKIQRYDVSNGQTTDLADLYSAGVTRETNGLGISGDGQYFYVIDFNITSNPHIYQYDAQTGSIKTFNAANNGPNDNYRVRRGGVNLLNGIYYYSTTRQDSQENPTNVNNLYALNPQTGQSWYVGAVNTRADAAGQSGDLAFDNQGNMYFVVGQNGYAYVYVYSGTLPQTPNSNPINITPQYLNAVGGTGNGVGIAYGGGNLYISNTNGDFYRVDPSTGATIPPAMTGVGGNGNTVDLATCTSPNTLTVKKNYPNGRGNADDNVTLSAWRNTSTQVGQNVDTDGPATGVQTNQLGPVPILVGSGNSYTVRETAKGGANSLTAYDTSYSCTDTNDPTWPGKSGTIPTGDTQRDINLGEIPAGGAQARAIVCTFTNSPISGSVTWSKSGPDKTRLAGSEWTITKAGVTGQTIVTDCTNLNCSKEAYADQDSNPGAFKLISLQFGTYTLTESKAPAGFVKDTTPHTFTIDASNRNIVLNSGNPFINQQATPPTLPLTGGLSTDAFIIGGAGLIVLSVATALIMRRRKAVHV
jgi:LPXTG-motif cell wall-anchored protein